MDEQNANNGNSGNVGGENNVEKKNGKVSVLAAGILLAVSVLTLVFAISMTLMG